MDDMGLCDPYEDQLSAARYRAERDVAIQERNRLKKEVERLRHVDRDCAMLRGAVERIADVFGIVLGEDLTWCAGEMASAAERLSTRLMPPGMEWPRYEDGGQVLINDKVLLDNGVTEELYQVHFYGTGFSLYTETCDVDYEYGMRVKRPAPKVLDADGVEIREGDTVYNVKDGSEMTVYGIEGEWLVVSVGGHVRHDVVTHRAPVLAADGKPLREGETVWVTRDSPYDAPLDKGDEVTVRHAYSKTVSVEDETGESWIVHADYLTHERPVADTWERLEEDARQLDINLNDTTDDFPRMSCCRDLVRRAKALAGVSE